MASIISASTTDELLTKLGEEYVEWAVTIDKEGYDLAKLKATSIENLVADIGLPNNIATGIYEALHKPSIDTSGPGIIVFYRALRAIDDEVAQGMCDIFTSAIIENGPERDGFKNSIETIEDDNLKNFALKVYDLMIEAAKPLDGVEAAKEYSRELMSSFKGCLKETEEEKFKVAFSSGFNLETLERVVIEKKPVPSTSSTVSEGDDKDGDDKDGDDKDGDDKDGDDDDEDFTYRRASTAYEDDDEDVTYRRASTGRASTTGDDYGDDY